MASPAALTTAIPAAMGEAPWAGHEYVRGWGVFGQPWDSGHVLALRVFPQSSFGAYATLWHRDPEGHWSIHVHGSRPELACPRYYGPACSYVGPVTIDLTWTGSRTLRVQADGPEVSLDWTLTLSRNPLLGLLNPLSARLPLASWRPAALVRARELMARALGMGSLRLAGPMPSGHQGLLMPGRMYLVRDATAVLGGTDLGRPVRLRENPDIGGSTLPARGVLAVGQGVWDVRDDEEFRQARVTALHGTPS
ncbi:MAG: hypothetical protein J7518_01730 [Nocardioidaceae bacterium]|nr:hypothetical protein [Nocardioidaceae bacterium]